jgi:hypothetical protein
VTWPDFPRLVPDAWQGEALAALILGKIDAFEISRLPSGDPWNRFDIWYRLLSAGFRPALVGASGKESNVVPLGSVRTYARPDERSRFSLTGWAEAVRQGRTFLTSGPLLFLDVNGSGPGSVLRAEVGQRLRVRASALSSVLIENVEILQGGAVLARTTSIPSPERMKNREAAFVEAEVEVRESTWFAARCSGPELWPGGGCAAAHTSGVFVEVAAHPLEANQETLAPLFAALDGTADWVEQQAQCETDRQRAHLLGVLRSAREELARRQV